MTHFPASPFWSVMFFFMLINLGLGSMIGTMTGITTPVLDTYKVQKELLTGRRSTPLSFLQTCSTHLCSLASPCWFQWAAAWWPFSVGCCLCKGQGITLSPCLMITRPGFL